MLVFQPNTVAVNPGRELFCGTTGHHKKKKKMGMSYKKCLKGSIGKNQGRSEPWVYTKRLSLQVMEPVIHFEFIILSHKRWGLVFFCLPVDLSSYIL